MSRPRGAHRKHQEQSLRTMHVRAGMLVAAAVLAMLAACATKPDLAPPATGYLAVGGREKGREVVMYGFGLIDIGYRFGGKNPESGLDCSGMVAYIYEKVTGARLPHNAREIARLARPVERSALQAGDLVFFNTRNRPFSHMGIFVGDGRFMHAPSSGGRIKLSSLSERYYATRFDSARTLLKD